MYTKAIPKPLQLTPRRLLKHSKNTQSYDAKNSSSAASSLQNTDAFAETDSRSTWEVLTDSPPPTAGFSPLCQDSVIPSPPKSSGKIKRWLLRRKTADTSQDSVASTVEITKPPTTAPADLGPGFSPYHSRPVPDLKIEPPQLSLEELAKVDAFYAPTPILSETPAPRTGKVYPPWSPDIDYRFKPERSASKRFRSIKTADVERGISRAESLTRLCALDVNSSSRSEGNQDLSDQIPTSSRSEITSFDRQRRDSNMRTMSTLISSRGGESWRHQWVYSKDGDETYPNIETEVEEEEDAEEGTLASDTEQECDDSGDSEPVTPPGGRLFFIMGDSPVEDSGEVTLRFVKDHLERPLSSTEIDVPSSRPSSLVDSLY